MKRKKKKKLTGIAQMKAMMKELGYDSEEINSKIQQFKDLKGWTPITINELIEMSQEDMGKLMSYCWHDGSPRCDCIGISHLKITSTSDNSFKVEYSDSNGDPTIYGVRPDEEINNIGDGEWNYGLYKKA